MAFFQKGELKLLWPFYLDHIISPLLFFMPAFNMLYFLSIGLSYFQVSILGAAQMLFALIFEIPTGAFADVFGRKASVLFGFIMSGLGLILLIFTKDFYPLLFISCFLGFTGTFASGAKEAWVADLIKKKDKKLMRSYFSNSMALDSFGLVVSGLVGVFAVKEFGLAVIWYSASFCYLLSAAILAFGKEYFVKAKTSLKKKISLIKSNAISSVKYSRFHPVIFYVLLANIFIFIAYASMYGSLSWTPFLKGFGLPDSAFGYLWTLFGLAGVIAPLIGMRLSKHGGERKLIVYAYALFALSTFVVLAINTLWLAIVIQLLGDAFILLSRPSQRVYFHRFIPSSLRASIGSVESMLNSLIGIIFLPVGGYLLTVLGPRLTIALAGVVAIPAVIAYIIIKESAR